jgi:hypothetical protein
MTVRQSWGVWVSGCPNSYDGWLLDGGEPFQTTEEQAAAVAAERNAGPKSWPTVRFQARELPAA